MNKQALELKNPRVAGSGALSKQIYAVLSDRIVSLSLKPFEQLSEVNVATELGVSRTPVREAFVRLSELGIVDIYPQRGTLVAPIRMPELEKSQFLREALELALLRRAMASGRTAELVGRLRAEIAVQKAFIEVGELQRFYQSDEDFHATIAEFAGMASVTSEIERVKIHINRARYLMISGVDDIRLVLEQHKQIADAIESNKPSVAEAAMEQHLRRVLEYIGQAQEKFPEYFETNEPARLTRRQKS